MRKRGMTKIEEWKHEKYGFNTTIYLERTAGKFHARLGDEQYEAPTLSALREELQKVVEASLSLKWIPVLKILVRGHGSMDARSTSDSHDATLDLEFERFWLAKHGDQWLVCTVWHSEDFKGSDHFNYDRDTKKSMDAPLPRRLNAHGWSEPKGFALPSCTIKEHTFGRQEVHHYVEYTEELWLALCNISGRIGALKENLDALLGDPQRRATLVAHLPKLLPS